MKVIQKKVDEWVNQHKEGYWDPMAQVVKLTEEVGELAREVMHLHGPKKKKATEEPNEISNELGDIIFDIVCIANNLEIDLDEAFERTMDKVNTRDRDRFEKK